MHRPKMLKLVRTHHESVPSGYRVRIMQSRETTHTAATLEK
jgi:hypothetical protein